ncbi:hypothetical protein [Thauera butanivorans]|uniref:hypothetical protein n=1 Tax=Thauera butanivorans TaxID=86174 RepID=UPI0012FAA538|nr:hypothetical protein [Thauera butanivorans]
MPEQKKIGCRTDASAVRLPSVMALILALAGFAFVIHASYPGYMNADSFGQLQQILDGRYGGLYSHFTTFVWSLAHAVLPGPAGFIVLDNLLIWGALALLVRGAVRITGAWSLLVLVVPWLPGVFNYLGHVHRDAMLAAWLLMAFACAFKANQAETGPRARIVWQLLANMLALAIFLIRENAIFGLIPLLLYANLCFGWRRNLLAAVLMLCLMPVTQMVQNRLLGVESVHAGDGIKAYHLVALSYFENRNLFPGQWSEDESRAIVENCYSPVQWDTIAGWGQCSGVFNGLWQQGMWGSGQLTRAWLDALARNPLGGYSAMAATFHLSMHDPNSRGMLFEQPRSETVQFDFASPPRTTTELARTYIRSDVNDRFGRPWVFAVVFVLAGSLIFGLRLSGTPFGTFALAIIASGTIYLLTYFPFNVSAEYRYFYWCGVAAWLGLVFALLAWIARRKSGCGASDGSQELPVPVRLVSCLVLALMAGLVFSSARLPLELRTVLLVPQGDGAIAIARLGTASTPWWMARHEGEIEAPGWHWQNASVLRAEPDAGVLIARIETLHHAIRLQLLTGPDGGSVQVQDGAFSRLVDTHAAEPGEIVLDLPPRGKLADRSRHASWHAPARMLLWTILLTILLFYLGRIPGRRWRALKRSQNVPANLPARPRSASSAPLDIARK